MATCMGAIDIVDPSAEVLVVDDEQAAPVLLRRRCGEGTVYFLNSWAYPGAMQIDEGPGSTLDSPGLIGMVFRHIARRCRGPVWISDDGDEPGAECRYVAYSHFPRSATLCIQNVDFDRPHAVTLHRAGRAEPVELAPGEFRMVSLATDAPGGTPTASVAPRPAPALPPA
jgi:hypothetical protein